MIHPRRIAFIKRRFSRDPLKSGGALCATALAYSWLAAASPFAIVTSAHAADAASPACPKDNTGIVLSPGFCATVFASNLGHTRHLAVASDGTVYANSWSGVYYHNGPVPGGGFILALKDTKGTGHADVVKRFGRGESQGAKGGTGIAIYKDGLFVEERDKILRYALKPGEIAPSGKPEVVLSGMPLGGDHPMHPFVIDAQGNLYVDMGSATNACQEQNRIQNSKGIQPCTELETRGGTWRYDANKLGQRFSPKERFATGLRNGEGFGFDSKGQLFATQHGRDQLYENWPKLFSADQGHNMPAEEIVAEHQGADFGWPECYFDGYQQKKLMLAPEYGGDGKTVGVCAQKEGPVAYLPAHWAPNDMLIYTATAFPKPYFDGAFVAFHGSWNRAPAPQGGYNVVFQPMKDGKANGPYVVFADGFAGPHKEPGRALFRPTGLAVGPDGALYISDDVRGRIWRVTYHGPADATTIAPSAPGAQVAATSPDEPPPEGVHPNAGRDDAALPVPQGATKAQVAEGDGIFHGASGGTCSGCHGSDGKGTSVGPDLTTSQWIWGDGSLASIEKIITDGVAKPKNFTGVMPPKGGAPLSDAKVKSVAAYVWAISHPGK
jgi:glucose/arabinose dehydrogenase/cytochrome c553